MRSGIFFRVIAFAAGRTARVVRTVEGSDAGKLPRALTKALVQAVHVANTTAVAIIRLLDVIPRLPAHAVVTVLSPNWLADRKLHEKTRKLQS